MVQEAGRLTGPRMPRSDPSEFISVVKHAWTATAGGLKLPPGPLVPSAPR